MTVLVLQAAHLRGAFAGEFTNGGDFAITGISRRWFPESSIPKQIAAQWGITIARAEQFAREVEPSERASSSTTIVH